MKKFVSFLAAGLFLAIPFTANAALLGTGQLDVSWGPPTAGGYYGDYDGTVVSSDFGYTTGLVEIFCVSKDPANGTEVVDFYTVTADLDSLVGFSFTNLSRAAWIADNWTNYGTTDADKVEAQKAIWEIMGVVPGVIGGDGLDVTIYNAAIVQTGYMTSNWVFAHSPGGNTTANYQDYLTPIHEPATMLLFGVGLIGMVGLGRKKFIKR